MAQRMLVLISFNYSCTTQMPLTAERQVYAENCQDTLMRWQKGMTNQTDMTTNTLNPSDAGLSILPKFKSLS